MQFYDLLSLNTLQLIKTELKNIFASAPLKKQLTGKESDFFLFFARQSWNGYFLSAL